MSNCKICNIPITEETGYKRTESRTGFHKICKYCYNEKYKEKQQYMRDAYRNFILPKQIIEYYIKTHLPLHTIAEKHDCNITYVIATIKKYDLYDINFENIYIFELTRPRVKLIKCNILKQHLEYNHCVLQKSIKEISLELKIDTRIITKYMKYYDIYILRVWENKTSHIFNGHGQSEETKKKMSKGHIGCKNGNWKGGTSYEPYCPKWTKELRERIRAYFDYRCILCGKTETENGRKLSCHHVEYNKLACCDGKLVHFAALCDRCHSKTNFDREHWQDIIHRIIDEIYDGKSYYTKEEYEQLVTL